MESLAACLVQEVAAGTRGPCSERARSGCSVGLNVVATRLMKLIWGRKGNNAIEFYIIRLLLASRWETWAVIFRGQRGSKCVALRDRLCI